MHIVKIYSIVFLKKIKTHVLRTMSGFSINQSACEASDGVGKKVISKRRQVFDDVRLLVFNLSASERPDCVKNDKKRPTFLSTFFICFIIIVVILQLRMDICSLLEKQKSL